MIRTIKQGEYQLLETKAQTKILLLGGETYAWINAHGIGEILVASHNPHETDTILTLGDYKLYGVEDEPKLSDQQHLELEVGQGMWQGYLLPTGLPKDNKKRSRVIPTSERITQLVSHGRINTY